MERMPFDRSKICEIEMGFEIVANDVIDHVLAGLIFGLKFDGANVLGHLVDIVLMKTYPSNAARIAFQDHRPVFEIRCDVFPNVAVIADEICFGVSFIGPVNAVETREADGIFADLDAMIAL